MYLPTHRARGSSQRHSPRFSQRAHLITPRARACAIVNTYYNESEYLLSLYDPPLRCGRGAVYMELLR